MKVSQKTLVILIVIFLLGNLVYAADINYPYAKFRLTYPPLEDPLPGLGNNYSSLSLGMKSALWNPASLGKLKILESSLSSNLASQTYDYQRAFKFNEMSGTMEGGATYGIFYRYPQNITGIQTREIEILTSSNYSTLNSGNVFTSAMKITDWLTFGFATGNSTGGNIEIAGDFPVTSRLTSSLYGQKVGEMQIANSGKLTYTFSSDGTVTTYESTKAIWTGFLSQEATIPLTGLSELRNNINIQSPYTGTIAANLGKFSLGLNLIPINATANIENDQRVIINADAQDQFFYTPNFDPDNQDEIASWINDSDKYSTSAGYKRKTIRLPAGELIAEAKYRGYYSASATRLDIGTQFDVSEWLTIGAVLENYGGSSLNFKGNGIASYINYRDINTAEAGNIADLLSPRGKTTIDLIMDRWITTDEVSGTKLYLEPEKIYDLPKKMRVGIALKRPFMIAIDYEQNQSPIKVRTTDQEITVSNLNFIRIGMDLGLLKGATVLMLKPTVAGADQSTQDTINTLFRYRVFPVRLDLGSGLNLWGTEIGSSFGINVLPIIDALQLNTTQADLSRLIYISTYVKRDAWTIDYRLALDPITSAMAYANRPDKTKTLEAADYLALAKFIQTLGVTYTF